METKLIEDDHETVADRNETPSVDLETHPGVASSFASPRDDAAPHTSWQLATQPPDDVARSCHEIRRLPVAVAEALPVPESRHASATGTTGATPCSF